MNPVVGILVTIVVLANIAGLVALLAGLRRRPGETAGTTETTGHVWDEDLRELNNPLPRWWLWLFVLTVVFGLGYLVVYPGLGNYAGDSRLDLAKAVPGPECQRGAGVGAHVGALRASERNGSGKRRRRRPCRSEPVHEQLRHVSRLGRTRRPWLSESHRQGLAVGRQTRRYRRDHSARSDFGDACLVRSARWRQWRRGRTRLRNELVGTARAGGRCGKWSNEVCGHLLRLSWPRRTRQPDVGRANLTDQVWLNGGALTTVRETIAHGRQAQMPAQLERLGETRVKLLAAYVISLGGADAPPPP